MSGGGRAARRARAGAPWSGIVVLAFYAVLAPATALVAAGLLCGGVEGASPAPGWRASGGGSS